MEAASGPLMDTAENRAGWASVHLDVNEVGSIDLVNKLDEYAVAFVSSANVDYIESYHPLFDADRNEMVVHTTSKAMAMSVFKAEQIGLNDRYGSNIKVKTFFESHPVNPSNMWDEVEEEIDIPTEIFYKNSSMGCGRFPVTFSAAVYDGFGKMSPVRRNPT